VMIFSRFSQKPGTLRAEQSPKLTFSRRRLNAVSRR
jgi:hypothetical protein